MPTSKKCNHTVKDFLTGKNRKCRNNHVVEIDGKKYCHTHYDYNYKSYVIYIQKIYRGFKSRRKIKYFKLCPLDIQRKILFYVKEEYYIVKFNKSVGKLVINNIELFIKRYFGHYIYVDNLVFSISKFGTNDEMYNNDNPIDIILNKLFHIFYLIDKYNYKVPINNYYYYFGSIALAIKMKVYESLQKEFINGIFLLENFKYYSSIINFIEKNAKAIY